VIAMPTVNRTIAAMAPTPDALGLDHVTVGGEVCPVVVRSRRELPFARLVVFSHAGVASRPSILLVPPLSGHQPILLRELIAGLVRTAPVAMLHWRAPCDVPARDGRFGFEDNILHIAAAIRELGPQALIVALCQSVVPALAAAALVAADDAAAAPCGLVLMAGPVDPLAQPTRVVRALRARDLAWFHSHVIASVPPHEPGAGRLIYPAGIQRAGLLAYLGRHLAQGGELFWKVAADDGIDPLRYPFVRLFLSLVDLPAELFLENIAAVFHERRICSGGLSVGNECIALQSLRRTALLTIEGEHDDIAAPGQTAAAHQLCTAIPASAHSHLLVEGAGHFSLFYGETWRRQVMPAIEAFAARTSNS
jgi:poly(3-hydroxybutyrate) depolymerase